MQIQKTILVDMSVDLLLRNVKEIQSQRNLNIDDMEIVLERVLGEIRKEKQTAYANLIFDLSLKMQEMENALKQSEKAEKID